LLREREASAQSKDPYPTHTFNIESSVPNR
jgi:hypothetical protein